MVIEAVKPVPAIDNLAMTAKLGRQGPTCLVERYTDCFKDMENEDEFGLEELAIGVAGVLAGISVLLLRIPPIEVPKDYPIPLHCCPT